MRPCGYWSLNQSAQSLSSAHTTARHQTKNRSVCEANVSHCGKTRSRNAEHHLEAAHAPETSLSDRDYSTQRGGCRPGTAELPEVGAELPAGADAAGARSAPEPVDAGASGAEAPNIDVKTRYATTRTASRPPPIASICLRFSAARRFRTLRASMTSRGEGIELDVSAASAIVSAPDAVTAFFEIDVELFEPDLRAFLSTGFSFVEAAAASL